MSEQDATESDGDADRGETTDASTQEEPPEDAAETVEEIAEKPEDEADDVLAEIIANAISQRESDADGDHSDPGREEVPIEEELLERIEEASPERTAEVVATLRERVTTLEERVDDQRAEIEDLESRLKRKQADFQNYKKRQKERLEEEKQRATEEFVTRILDVRDNLARALDQDEDADIRSGVETTLTQFDEQLQRENVERVEPDPGEDVDPQRHEALATIASDEPEGTVADVHRPGYEMAGKVIRPAQVAVSDGSGANDEDDGND